MKITINDNSITVDNIIIDKSIINISFINKSNIYYNYHNTYTKIKFICKKVVVSRINKNYYYCIEFINFLPCFNYPSNILISKGISEKCRSIILYLTDIYNIFFYTYFIHKKYFIQINDTKYENLIDTSITSKKLFNCRDYYRIHSYI